MFVHCYCNVARPPLVAGRNQVGSGEAEEGIIFGNTSRAGDHSVYIDSHGNTVMTWQLSGVFQGITNKHQHTTKY